MSKKGYWIVEYRLPIFIEDAEDAKDATQKASKEISRETGVDVSNWFARVFEYGTGELEDVGVQEEYFFNPTGVSVRVIEQNHAEHDEIVKEMKAGKEN